MSGTVNRCRTFTKDPHDTKAEFDAIVCARVADLAVPHVPSEKSTCSECQAEVWVAKRTLAFVTGPILCVRCVLKKAKEDDPCQE